MPAEMRNRYVGRKELDYTISRPRRNLDAVPAFRFNFLSEKPPVLTVMFPTPRSAVAKRRTDKINPP